MSEDIIGPDMCLNCEGELSADDLKKGHVICEDCALKEAEKEDPPECEHCANEITRAHWYYDGSLYCCADCVACDVGAVYREEAP